MAWHIFPVPMDPDPPEGPGGNLSDLPVGSGRRARDRGALRALEPSRRRFFMTWMEKWEQIFGGEISNLMLNWGFPKIGVPQNGWFIMENPFKMDHLGVPLFSETSQCC